VASDRTVEFRISVDADTQGLEVFNRSLNALRKTTDATDKELAQFANEIKTKLNGELKNSPATINAVASALTQLQQNMTAGSTASVKLSGEINKLKGDLDKLTASAEAAKVTTQFYATTANGMRTQIGALSKDLGNLNFRSDAYIERLQRINELQLTMSRRQARLGTVAMQNAFSGPVMTGGYGSDAGLPDFARTPAGYKQRLSELQQQLENTGFGAARQSVQSEIGRLQNELRELTGGTQSLNTLKAKLGEVNAEMRGLDQSTQAGRAEFARLSGESRQITAQLKQIENSYRNVADATRNATAATSQYRKTALFGGPIPPMYVPPDRAAFNARMAQATGQLMLPAAGETVGSEIRRRDRQARIAERAAQVEAYNNDQAAAAYRARLQFPAGPNVPIQQFPLALPAAGQTSGFVDERTGRGGGARPLIPRNVVGEFSAYNRLQNPFESTFGNDANLRNARAQRFLNRDVNAATYDPSFGVRGTTGGPPASELTDSYFARRREALGGFASASERDRAARQAAAAQQQQRRPSSLFNRAGAISAGGFFGGPEGAIGGLIGGIGGAAAGAQVGILRKQIGEFAELSAQLTRYQIALKNVAGTEGEYQQALGAITSANERLNIPLVEGTQSFTQLAAAVIGAGGKVKDAELAFNAVNSAIKATGGNTSDVQGALLAITQVFSKGKVSAEELRRQLGDRLPGAFNLFAESIGKTGPELDKALQQGEVGLNDLITFLVELERKFGPTAEGIARSSEDAGARLAVAWEQARLAIGEALQPIGAEFQEGLIKFLSENDEALKAFAGNLATGATGLFEFTKAVGPTAIELGKLVLIFKGSQVIVSGLTAAYGTFTKAQAALQAALSATSVQAAFTTGALGRLTLATKALASAFAAPLLLTVGIVGVSKILGDIGKIREAKARLEELKAPSESTDEYIRRTFRNSAPSAENRPLLISELESLNDATPGLVKKVNDLKAQSTSLNQRLTSRNAASERLKVAEEELRQNRDRLAAVGGLLGQIGTGPGRDTGNTQFPQADPKEAGGRSAADDAAREAERLAAEQRRLAEQNAAFQREQAKKLFDFQLELDQRRYENLRRLEDLRAQNLLSGSDPAERRVLGLGVDLAQQLGDLLGGLVDVGVDVRRAQQQLDSAKQFQATVSAFEVPARSARAAATGSVLPPQVIEYLTGDPAMRGSRYYDPAGHGGAQHHEHLAFTSRAERDRAAAALRREGITVGSMDRPGDTGSYHSTGQALDVPAYPNFSRLGFPDNAEGEQRLGALVRSVIWKEFTGASSGASSGSPVGSPALRAEMGDNRAGFDVASAEADIAQSLERQKIALETAVPIAQEYFKSFQLRLTEPMRDMAAEQTRELERLKQRNRLLLEGVDPAIIDFEDQMLGMTQRQTAERTALFKVQQMLTTAVEKAQALGNDELTAKLQAQLAEAEGNVKELDSAFDAARQGARDLFNETQRLEEPWERLQLAINNVKKELSDLQDPVRQTQQLAAGIGSAFGNSFGSIITGSSSVREAMSNLFRDISNQFAQMVSNIIAKAIEAQILGGAQGTSGGFFGGLGGLLFGALGGGFGGGGSGVTPFNSGLNFLGGASPLPLNFSAQGNTFGNSIVPFARGGLVESPTLFKYARGGTMRAGLMAENAPEAILPLQRMPNGDLGVTAAGGGKGTIVNNVSVNVDASGSSVSGDGEQSRQLGKVISEAVQAELVKQQRPGGLLGSSRTKR